MLASLFLTVIDALVSLFTGMLLMRFVMQWQRVTFRNPLGQFVLATTDWLVVPVRRVIPGLFGFDMASLLPAWILQALVVFLTLMVRGSLGLMDPLGLVLVVWGVGLLGVAKTVLYLVMGVVLMSAVFSWVNPHAPLAGVVNALSEPFLRPFRRVIPLVGGVDLSPIALLLLLQVLLSAVAMGRYALVGMA
ncbi:YggT family protein [Zoogloea sp.]|uniref:YggT family protein n=1 Tax=Zoogloea sp. TaxID=49181 RepID=UPI0035B1A1B0|nr:YggT family protein [Rhodocyclales bacterium]